MVGNPPNRLNRDRVRRSSLERLSGTTWRVLIGSQYPRLSIRRRNVAEAGSVLGETREAIGGDIPRC